MPIDIHEIRVGSVINYKGEPFSVLGIYPPAPRKEKHLSDKYLLEIGVHDSFSVSVDDCEGIVLTEDWMLKCGAKIADDNWGGYFLEVRPTESIRIRLRNGKWGWPLYSMNPVQCNYIHQLQLLYQSLTGKELPITNI